MADMLTVRPLHQASRAQDAAPTALLTALNPMRIVFPHADLRLVYKLPPNDCYQSITAQCLPSGVSAQSRDIVNKAMKRSLR